MRVLQVASQDTSLFVTAITLASLAAARLFAIMLEASNLPMFEGSRACMQNIYSIYYTYIFGF
jgi:hypothetical protein